MAQDEFSRGHTIVVGPLDKIEKVDDGVCGLLGYTREQIMTLHGSELIPPESRPAVAVTLDRVRASDSGYDGRGVVLRKDDSRLSVEVAVRKLPGERLMLVLRRAPLVPFKSAR